MRSTRKPLLTPERPPTAPCSPPPSLGRRACPRRQPARAAPASTEPASRCRPPSLPASASSSRRRTRRVRATPRTAATPCPRFVYFVDARNVEELAQRERAKKGGKKQGEGHGGEQAKKRRLRREKHDSFNPRLTYFPSAFDQSNTTQRRGIKVYGGKPVKAGGIIVRQLGTKVIRIRKMSTTNGGGGKLIISGVFSRRALIAQRSSFYFRSAWTMSCCSLMSIREGIE